MNDGAPVVPLLITQVNSEAALGIPPRRFRELVRELRLPAIEFGKLRAVEVPVLLPAYASARRSQKRPRRTANDFAA